MTTDNESRDWTDGPSAYIVGWRLHHSAPWRYITGADPSLATDPRDAVQFASEAAARAEVDRLGPLGTSRIAVPADVFVFWPHSGCASRLGRVPVDVQAANFGDEEPF